MTPVIRKRDHERSEVVWQRYFKSSVDSICDWYGLSREEVLSLVAEKISLGYVGHEVFEAVRADLESRDTKILERT